MQIFAFQIVNPTLYGFGFGLWSLPEWSERLQILAQFMYDIYS